MVELRKNINVLSILLIPVYLLVMWNSIRNTHTHVLPTGEIITHAHPFTDSKTGLPVPHSHSRNQIVFYQLFTFDYFDAASEIILADQFSMVRYEVKIWRTEQVSVSFPTACLLRGPPAV